MPSVPNSLTITASRRVVWVRRWRSSVVLPAPKNPVTMVQGMRGASLGATRGEEAGWGVRRVSLIGNPQAWRGAHHG